MKNLLAIQLLSFIRRINEYAKDDGEERFTKRHCALSSNPHMIVKDSKLERNCILVTSSLLASLVQMPAHITFKLCPQDQFLAAR